MPEDVRTKAIHFGSAVDPFVQDITFLPLIETIIRRLDYLPYLFLHAVYVFFDHISQNWLQSHPTAGYNIEDIELAGRSLESVRANFLRTRSEGGPQIVRLILLGGAVFDKQISTLLPLTFKTNVGDNEILLDPESGIMGLIGTACLSSH